MPDHSRDADLERLTAPDEGQAFSVETVLRQRDQAIHLAREARNARDQWRRTAQEHGAEALRQAQKAGAYRHDLEALIEQNHQMDLALGHARRRPTYEPSWTTVEEGTMVDEYVTSSYSPSVVGRWLLAWPHLIALSQSPGSARGLTRPGPTPETPKIGSHGQSGNSMQYACIVADLERAWARALVNPSLEYWVVEGLMNGWSLGRFAAHTDLEMGDCVRAYQRGAEKMACYLGWRESVPAEEYERSGKEKV
jgi:hypothetical protein